MEDNIRDTLKGLLIGLLACAAIELLWGCRSVRYVEVPSVSTDSVYVDRWLRDSVYVHDSVFVSQYSKGDTVYVDKVATRYRYRYRWRHDTTAVMRADTIRVAYPVEKELSWWEKTKLRSFPLLVAVIAVLAFIVAWLAKKLKKK